MSKPSTLNRHTLFAVALFLFFLSASAYAQTTAFTYQGKLVDNNTLVTGNYDFQFKLFTVHGQWPVRF